MKINREMIRNICTNVFKTLLILGALVVLAGFLWVNQKPNFSKYHSYAIAGDGGNVPLTDEQFQRIVEAYENDEMHYMIFSDRVCAGYEIYLYKTKDMSGQYDVLRTGDLQTNFIMIYRKTINGDISCKSFEYENSGEENTFRQVQAVIREAINEAKGK